MKRKNIIQCKSFNFALDIVKTSRELISEKKEFVMPRQLLKSGTSIGANIEEAIGGQTKKDFILKLSIAYKEARETSYWIRLLKGANIISKDIYKRLYPQAVEISKILTTTKARYHS